MKDRCQQMHVVLPAHVYEKVKRYAQRERISMSRALDRMADGLERFERREGDS